MSQVAPRRTHRDAIAAKIKKHTRDKPKKRCTPTPGARVLGEGAYGLAEVRPGQADKAWKKFLRRTPMVQEVAAMNYLQRCNHIARIHSHDIANSELSMQLYDGTLREWSRVNRPHEQKMKVTKDILRGLVELHDRALVHGDITPRNIFMFHDPLKCVIGDLGFVSVSSYAKVDRTAPIYRDSNWNHSYAHDIYSLGMIMIELFGNTRFEIKDRDEIITRATIERTIEAHIRDVNLKKLLLLMTHPEHEQRPRASTILYKLFNERIDVTLPELPELDSGIVNSKQAKTINKWMARMSEMYHIQRPKRVLSVVYLYIEKFGDDDTSKYKLYATAALVTAMCMFGRKDCTKACPKGHSDLSPFRIAEGSIKDKFTMDELYIVISDMIADRDILEMLLLP